MGEHPRLEVDEGVKSGSRTFKRVMRLNLRLNRVGSQPRDVLQTLRVNCLWAGRRAKWH